jgi:hypothetical protein
LSAPSTSSSTGCCVTARARQHAVKDAASGAREHDKGDALDGAGAASCLSSAVAAYRSCTNSPRWDSKGAPECRLSSTPYSEQRGREIDLREAAVIGRTRGTRRPQQALPSVAAAIGRQRRVLRIFGTGALRDLPRADLESRISRGALD